MYVARVLNGFTVKRMPNTGRQHATTCPSYEPPAEFSGLGPLVGTAIVENPATGMTTLKLDFPMSKLPGRAAQPPISQFQQQRGRPRPADLACAPCSTTCGTRPN